jgi:nitrate/nitrite-specific signal transduction histidine kinase
LGIMRERAANTHAALSIKSKPGVGTEISVQWPQLEP